MGVGGMQPSVGSTAVAAAGAYKGLATAATVDAATVAAVGQNPKSSGDSSSGTDGGSDGSVTDSSRHMTRAVSQSRQCRRQWGDVC
jgi:hypothetical protein